MSLFLGRDFSIKVLPRTSIRTNTLRWKLFLAITASLVFGILVNETAINMWIASRISDGTNGFPLRGDWLVQRVLHYYGGKLTIVIALCIVSFNLIQWVRPSKSVKAIVSGRYIMYSWLSSILTIGVIKHTSTLPCPVDLQAFGGNEVYVSIVDLYSAIYPVGGCFPSAHSSGGYALMSFAFVALVYGRAFLPALIAGVLMGAIYGTAQIFRGMHFASHDFFTFAICMGYAWLWAELYLFKKTSFSPKSR
jgi:membrane-associated PAP2 superfamily phosphatase